MATSWNKVLPPLPRDGWLATLWAGLGAVLAALCWLLADQSARFDYEIQVVDMPAMELGLGLAAAGIIYLAVLPLIACSQLAELSVCRAILWLVFAFGLAFRLILCTSQPALEDDWYRYLWEGGMVAHGHNPYAMAPEKAREAEPFTALAELADGAGFVLDRVNHAHLRTVYPPVAQAAFALAHLIAPWELWAWRAVTITADLAIAAFILLLLRGSGRSPLWLALYWWNPVVLKELANSGHMEGVLMALVMAATWLATRGRTWSALVVVALAMGTKLWPVFLVPLIMRPLWPRPIAIAGALALVGAFAAAWALPAALGGLDDGSGFVAYALHWKNSSALFPLIESGFSAVSARLGWSETSAPLLARACIGLTVAIVGLVVAFDFARPRGTALPLLKAEEIVRRAALVATVLVLLSPSQFPWYMLWVLPFIAVTPRPWLLIVTVTAPLYYLSFHHAARETYQVFSGQIVWLMWTPVWLAIVWRLWQVWRDHLGERT